MSAAEHLAPAVVPIERLTGPRERFRCEPLNAVMEAGLCMLRRSARNTRQDAPGGRGAPKYPTCAACPDGARAELLERCTHNPTKKERSIDVYSTFEWAPLCTAVAALRFGPADHAGEKDEGAGRLDTGARPLATALATGTASTAENPRPAEWRRRESKPAPPPLAGLPQNPFAAFDAAFSASDRASNESAMAVDGGLSGTTCSNVASPVAGPVEALLAGEAAQYAWYERALATEVRA